MNRKWIVVAGLITILVVVRAVAPSIILKKTNQFLASFSETYYAHIGDFDLSLWRGAYRFEQIRVAIKPNTEKPFLTAEVIDVSVAWSQLLRGRVLTDIIATEVDLIADAAVTQSAKKSPKKSVNEAGHAGKKLFPVNAERIELRNSRVEYRDLNLFVDQIEGRVSNVTADEDNPLSLLTFRGFFLGKAALKAVGKLNLTADPAAWVVSAELQKFSMPEARSITSRYLPLSFKSGELDIYSELKSEKGKISGYVKPFLKKADVVGDENDFKGLKHFGIELSVAAINLLFRSNESRTVATKILFTYEKGEFNWNMMEAIGSLFKNGYKEELSPGLENILDLSASAARSKDTNEKK